VYCDCTVYCVLVLCIVYRVLCVLHCVLCTVYSVLCTVTLCPLCNLHCSPIMRCAHVKRSRRETLIPLSILSLLLDTSEMQN
jgi:hypothetical protein